MILNCLQMTETVESLIYVIDDISSKVAETLGCMPNLSALMEDPMPARKKQIIS